jgi:hypothetical protein
MIVRRAPWILRTLALGLLLVGGAEAKAVVDEVGGVVDASRSGRRNWRRLELGDELAVGETIQTGPNGFVSLKQGERTLELGRRTRLRWMGADKVHVESGRVHLEQAEGAPTLEVRAQHTRAWLRAGRASLRARGPRDRWRSHEGTLEVVPGGGGELVQVEPGNQVSGNVSGMEAARPIPEERKGPRGRRILPEFRSRRDETEKLVRDDLRWQDTLDKLVTASRRLVRRAEKTKANPQDDVFEQLDELGAALEAARDRIEELTEERVLGNAQASRSAVDLAAHADRALRSHRSLSSRLERLRRPGPLGGAQAVGIQEVDASPTGRPDSRMALARIEEAMRFLRRYQQALRRFLRVLGRLVTLAPSAIPRGEAPQILGRIVGGYRQAERLVLQARAELQRVPRKQRSPQAMQRMQAMNRQWKLVGTQFRRAQELVRRIRAKVGALGP